MEYSKSGLAIELSRLAVFADPKAGLEQYPTDSEIAAEVLWQAYMSGDIEDKVIADLGCGTGILGIGALLLGARKVFFIDKDTAALGILGNNLRRLDINSGFEVHNRDIDDIDIKTDIVLQNPPFGTKERHADKAFLEKAFRTANIIYSFHKTTTSRFVVSISSDNDFIVERQWDFAFPIKQTLGFHKKRLERIKVSCFRLVKKS